jgi:hypothetical protein
MKTLLPLVLAFAALPAQATDMVSVKQIGLELARDIAMGAVEACRKDGYNVSAVVQGSADTKFAPALLRESDGCKARRAGKGHPLPSGATLQTRFLEATRRGGPIRAHPFVANRLQ